MNKLEGEISILERLSDERVFSMEITPQGLVIEEGCDNCFRTTLSAVEFERLIKEMQDIHRKMTSEATDE